VRKANFSGSGIITALAGKVAPERMGPIVQAQLGDPRALILAPQLTWVAGGSSGTVQAIRGNWVAAVAGRYPHPSATSDLARYRDQSFGAVTGIAYDSTAGLLFIAEAYDDPIDPLLSKHRLHVVSVVDPDDENTWTIAPLSGDVPGFADGDAADARFRNPSGLHYDGSEDVLYVADTGNHVIRGVDLSSGVGSATVSTIIGVPETQGFFGDGGLAAEALLFKPRAIARCANGDIFVSDTGNNRVRRIAAGTITTVLGDGVGTSSGQGAPSVDLPVHAPLGLACDGIGNVFVTSTTTVRLLAPKNNVVDGSGNVQTIFGAPPRDTFPATVTRCLTDVAVVDSTAVRLVDSCTGMLIELVKRPEP
jgi:hypothetical protein